MRSFCALYIMYLITFIITILCMCFINSHLDKTAESTCKLAHVVFRHGDRTPTETYANDPYINYSWPDGWGALTKKGKSQLYELGQTIRERYKHFFTEDAVSNTVYVRTSDADRCHMSGAVFLAGLYPPSKNQMWNLDLNWQPIPLHALPRNLDNIVAMKKKCPTYDKALKDAYNSEAIQAINKENEELYKYLTEATGQDINDITAVEFLFNTLEIEENNGLKLPAWTESVYPGVMKKLATRSLEIFTETEFMKRMKGGVMLKEIIGNTVAKQQNLLNPDRRMFIYSAHDITLINVLNTLGLSHDLKPDYGAAFIIEAHSTDSDKLEIKMFYYNDSSSKVPINLKLENCGEPCYLEDFIRATKQIIPTDWEKECQEVHDI